VQQNPYTGNPPRPWIRLELIALDRSVRELQLVADTGSPFAVIVSTNIMDQFRVRSGPAVETNFGTIVGGFLHVRIPDTRLDVSVLGHAGDPVVQAVHASSPVFQGVAGLPLLRLLEYGGDADEFWIDD
jgi:hypothetical protein